MRKCQAIVISPDKWWWCVNDATHISPPGLHNGRIIDVNAKTGHFTPETGVQEFREQAVKAFTEYAELKGLEFDPSVKFDIESPTAVVAQN